MANVEPIEKYLEPVRKSVVVSRPPREAFAIFTERLASWWPREKYSIYGADSATCGVEPRVGGEVFEVATDGRRSIWGTVLTWEPPGRFVMTWHPGRGPDTAQELELRFVPVAEGTRVELEHRGWEKLGAAAADSRNTYDGGWAMVFEVRYKEACKS